tara:strand:+ start:224 stop:475 length:252 start_codon:yes stop_codon:yes gene_type:complete
MSNKKLSSEELQTLKEFRTLNNETIVSLGTIDLQIHRLQKQKESILNGFDKLEEDQTKTAAELEKKYGSGQIDLEKGEIISID